LPSHKPSYSGHSLVTPNLNSDTNRARAPATFTSVPSRNLGSSFSEDGDGVTIFDMIDWSTCPAVERDPERVSGAWVFRDTRVPVSALFQNLEDGALVSQFVDWFPGVTPEQARAVLDHAARSALATA
jgi:uncharacterized protein (DUF433 family)